MVDNRGVFIPLFFCFFLHPYAQQEFIYSIKTYKKRALYNTRQKGQGLKHPFGLMCARAWSWGQLQLAFNTDQEHLCNLKLVLNADKTKVMLFSNTKSKPQNLPSILSSQGLKIECVSNYRYLGILIDESLSFANHIQQLVKRLKLKLGF